MIYQLLLFRPMIPNPHSTIIYSSLSMSYVQQAYSIQLKIPSASRPRSFNNIASLPITSTLSNSQIPSLHSISTAKDKRPSKKPDSMSQHQIGQDVVKVLREENLNLKQQNNFLLQKLRLISAKEEEAEELASKHEAILEELKVENKELKRELQYVNQLAHSKVQEFGKKLAKLSKGSEEKIPSEPNISLKDLNPPIGILQLNHAQSHSQSQRQLSSKKSQAQSEKPQIQEEQTTDGRSLEQLNNEFEAILYSCKVQKDNQKRKQYRRRMVELTYKMKKMKK